MSEHQRSSISDGEEEPDDGQIDHPNRDNDADIRKNLFDEFDDPVKEKTSSDTSGREYIKVYLRARPFSSEELEANEDQQCVERESRTSVLMNAPKESFAFKNSTRAGGEISHRFSFTNVFSEDTTQKVFFDETTLPLVTDFIKGQNCLVFTYGVTNSGKTYTIQGTPKDGGILPRSLDVLFNSIEGKSYERMDLKPRFCTDVVRLTYDEEQKESNFKCALLSSLNKETFDINAFLKLDQDSTADLSKVSCIDDSVLHNTIKSQDGGHEESSIDNDENISRVADDTTINVDAQGPVKFSVWVSYAEIYNETIFDLLEPCPTGKGKKRTTLRLGDDANGNPYIKGLREIYVSNADEAYKILKIGQKNQRIASTKLNQCSSRSHCIFSIKVLRVVDVDDPHVARVSRLSFVDLAGSERYSKTQSKGDRLKEAGNINTSLMTLGKCLEYLRYNQKNPNQPLIIPFRESKLTRLFQGFFCGKGRASMIVNVNMCASMFDETFHVMKFSAIAKKVTTRVSKPVDLPPPAKKARALAATPRSKSARPSVPWIKGALHTPAPCDDTLAEVDEEIEEESVIMEPNPYQQQLVDLVKVLQEQLIEEKRKMQTLEVKIREEVCKEMAEQLVSIEKAYSQRVKMEVTAVEEKCDRRIELLTQSVKISRKRARVERTEEDDEEWVSSVFLHAEQTKVREQQQLIGGLNAQIAELRQEIKQLKENKQEEAATSQAVLELQAHLNHANEEAAELKQMLEEAGEAFSEKEAEISKLKAALDEQEACIKKQDATLQHLTNELQKEKEAPKKTENSAELLRTQGALDAALAKLSNTEHQLETNNTMMKELVRTLEETREELAREKSYVAQAFDNDEELIRIKDELQKAEERCKELEKEISSLNQVIEDSQAERNTQAEETDNIMATEMAVLAKQLEAAKGEMHHAKAELETFKGECKEKESQLEKMKKEFGEKVTELDDAKKDICDKMAALDDMKKRVTEKETQLKTIQAENLKTTAELKNAKKVLEEEIAVLSKKECDVYQAEGPEDLSKESAQDIEKQEVRTKRVGKEIEEKDAELKSVKNESRRRINELESELVECKKEMKKLHSEDSLKELEKQLEESTKALDKKNSQVIARNNTIKRLEMSLAEKEKHLSEMEKLPKENNLKTKEELKTLRRRLVQADKEREESKDMMAKKNVTLEETRLELERLKREYDEKSAKFLEELQEVRAEIDVEKEETKKKDERIQSLEENLNSQQLKNACLQTQLENEKRNVLEKEKAVEEASKEMCNARSASVNELDEKKKRLASMDGKVHELQDELSTANETTSRLQTEIQRYKNQVVPDLEHKVRFLEEGMARSDERIKEAKVKLEQETNEANARLRKRNEEIEEKVKEIEELREKIKTIDQQKFQELDKVWKEMMSMQKTIEDRNKSIDELEQNIRKASIENEKFREQIRTLTDKVKTLNDEKSSMEGNLRLFSSDAGKDKDVIANLKKVLEEQDVLLAEQGQALEERQDELETLSIELQTWQEKCELATKELDIKKGEITSLKKKATAASDAMKDMSNKSEANERNIFERMQNMEKEIAMLQKERATLEEKLVKKDEEISKMNDSRDNIMKTMRQTLEVANAKKAEYEIKLSTIREQCRQDLRREMEEELRKTKRDYQRQLDDKDRSIEEIKHEKESVERELAAERSDSSKTDSSSDPDVADKADSTTSCSRSAKKPLKRNSSDIPLSQLKTKWTKVQKTDDSDEDFTPGSSRKTQSRPGTRQSVRNKQTTSATKSTTLPVKKSSVEETEPPKVEAKKKKLFKELQENTAVEDTDKYSSQSNEETENVPPKLTQSSAKKGKKLFKKPSGMTAILSPAKQGSREVKTEQESTRNIIARQLRSRAVKYS